jgi:hypothetical protein
VDSHPIGQKCTAGTLAHKGDSLDRYLIGRQFSVVLIVFATNLSGGPVKATEVVKDMILVTAIIGVKATEVVKDMILMTAIVGQFTSQVNGAQYVLAYININTNPMLFTLYMSLAIEASGLLHYVQPTSHRCSSRSSRASQSCHMSLHALHPFSGCASSCRLQSFRGNSCCSISGQDYHVGRRSESSLRSPLTDECRERSLQSSIVLEDLFRPSFAS